MAAHLISLGADVNRSHRQQSPLSQYLRRYVDTSDEKRPEIEKIIILLLDHGAHLSPGESTSYWHGALPELRSRIRSS